MAAEAAFTIPKVHTFQHILDQAKKVVAETGKPRAALVVPSEIATLKAFATASDKGLIIPTLIGDEKLAREKLSQEDISLDRFKFINLIEPDLAVKAAVKMAAAGETDLIVAGRILPISFLKVLLDKSYSFVKKGRVLSHVGVMKPALYKKLLFVTDAAVNTEPDLKCKLALITNAVTLASRIGVNMPRVALIAAVEVIYPQMPVTMDAAHGKGIKNSPVAGQTDILIAPNIETANGIYKAVSLYGRAEVGGVICGGRTPVILNSRSESAESRFNSIMLGVLSAETS